MSKIEDISLLIQSFSDITGVGICFYDLENFFMYSSSAVWKYTGHRCDLCTNIRKLTDKCTLSDGRDAVEYAATQNSPVFHQCHVGLYELLVPIYNGDSLCGLVFIGQCRIEGMNAESTIIKNAAKLGGDPEYFRKLYQALPLIRSEVLLSMGNIIKLYLENLVDLNNIFKLRVDNQDINRKIPLHERVKAHINQNYNTPLTLTSLSEIFFVNSSYLSRTFKQHTSVTVCDYINATRIRHAKLMLKSSDYPIRIVALNVGYPDANYFVKIFKKRTGITPTAYRRLREPPPNG